MEINRDMEMHVAGTVLQLPCFFPSVSSVRTNLKPVDYIDLLDLSGHPLYLISAYDLAHCPNNQRQRIDIALKQSKARGSVILMDSGNYESFWKTDKMWQPDNFHKIAKAGNYHLCFCYDNQDPPSDSKSIAEDVIASVLRDQDHALGTVNSDHSWFTSITTRCYSDSSGAASPYIVSGARTGTWRRYC